MTKNTYNVLGIMSGTSLDGVDIAHIYFTVENNHWTYEIYESETIPYSDKWIEKLKKAVTFSIEELQALNKSYTLLLGNTIRFFIEKHQINNLDAVCSHGHTILHQPQKGFTLQIGNLPEISKIIEKKVVCDFRVQDVELGGQGAPLVPIGDKILFSDYDFCLNLGGFSNVSFENNGIRIAFDISPVNTVLNFYANQLGFNYDDKGNIARSGKINNDLFVKLNTLEYYRKPFPKSLGFEYVKETILPLIEKFQIPIEDKMRTFSEHIALQTSLGLNFAIPNRNENQKLLITGGGAYNDFLIERIQSYLLKTQIVIPDKKTIEFKEALIFALLGVLKLRGEINVLSSVTGAKQNHSSGTIFEK